MKNKIQNSTILVLGSNPLSKKDLNYELLNLKYLPSIEQILALKPSLLIVNFNSYKAIYHSKLIELCEDLKSIYGLPIISIEDKKDQDLSLKETENQNLFENIWNTSFNINLASEQIEAVLEKENSVIKKEEESLDNLHQLEFQENILLSCLSAVNLKDQYYAFSNNQNGINNSFFKIINLSASQVAIFFAEINSVESIQAFLKGYLLAEINTLISTEQKNILCSTNSLLSKLSDSLYQLNKNSLAKVKAWYGIIDLANLKINYISAGKLSPLIYNQSTSNINLLKKEVQTELGLKDGIIYHECLADLEPESDFLFYTDNLCETEEFIEKFQNLCNENNPEIQAKKANLQKLLSDSSKDSLALYFQLEKNQEIHCLADSFSDVLPKIDEVLKSLPENLSTDIINELEIALQELFFKAYTKIQRSRLISSFNEESDDLYKQLNLFSRKGFKANWWTHSDRLDISVCLFENNIPWSWSNKADEDFEGISDLILFFDNIQINPNQKEITMSKNFF